LVFFLVFFSELDAEARCAVPVDVPSSIFLLVRLFINPNLHYVFYSAQKQQEQQGWRQQEGWCGRQKAHLRASLGAAGDQAYASSFILSAFR
jgi:hypothetical protein